MEKDFMEESINKHGLKHVENVLFYDENFLGSMKEDPSKQNYLEFLALCHNIMVNKGEYNATSPDELALVNFAKMCGIEFLGTNDENEMELNYFGQIRKYQLLSTLEFNSSRKRMSVIVRNEEGEIWMLTKGADNKIIERSQTSKMGETFVGLMEHLNAYAIEGLRTLLISSKQMSEEEYDSFKGKMDKAKSLLNGREEAVAAVEEEFETNLNILGLTAIEDRLQDQISESIFVRSNNY